MDSILKAQNCSVKFGKKKSLSKEQLDGLKQKRIQGIRIKNLMQELMIRIKKLIDELMPCMFKIHTVFRELIR